MHIEIFQTPNINCSHLPLMGLLAIIYFCKSKMSIFKKLSYLSKL